MQTLPSVSVPNTPGSFSAVVDLAALSALGEITFAVPGAGPLDQVQVYFTTNASAVNAASAIQGPLLSGPQPGPMPPQIPCRYVILERVAGTTTGLSAQISGQETPGTSANSGGSSGQALAISNLAATGPIGAAPATVDQYAFFDVAQTTASVNVTLPAPSAAANSRCVMVTNTGTAAFQLYGAMLLPNTSALVLWNGTQWQLCGLGSALSALGNALGMTLLIGTLDANGIRIITNGAGAVWVDVNQNMGVGQSSPKAKLDLAGAFLMEPVNVANLAGGGSVGTAATTVDVASILHVAQTTAGQALTLPPPTNNTAPGRLLVVVNTGTVPFVVGDATLLQNLNLMPGAAGSKGQACVFEWNGVAWAPLSAFSPTPAQGANLGDASVTVTRAGQFSQYTMPAGIMSAARTVTLPSAAQGAQPGDIALISRLDISAFTLTIANGGGGGGNTFVMPASKVNFHTARFDGTNWNFMSGGVQ